MRYFSTLLLLLLPGLVFAQQYCPALRVIKAIGVQYLVLCDTGPVEISVGEYNSNKRKGGQPWATYCTDGTTSASVVSPLVWNTASGQPEPCDAWGNETHQPLQQAPYVYVQAPDGLDIEVDTAVNVPLWQGQELLGFTPPLPDLVIGTQP